MLNFNYIGFAAVVVLVMVMPLPKADAQPPAFLFEVQITKPLGFYQQLNLNEPNISLDLNNLQPPTRVRIAGMTGPLWMPGTFCNAEYEGKPGYIRCDDPTAVRILPEASNFAVLVDDPQCKVSMTSGPYYTPDPAYVIREQTNAFGKVFCKSIDDCKAFCTRHCTFCLNKWKDTRSGHDGATTCPGAPKTGAGMIPESSDALHKGRIPVMEFVKASRNVLATKEAVEHLQELNRHLATSQEWAENRYTVRVKNCYRPAIVDIEKECNIIMKSLHQLNKSPEHPKKNELIRKLNPQNVGLSWPGANAHSAGNACDMVVLNANGDELFDSRIDPASPTARVALKMLDQAVTNVGGRRLNYEAWHYEWSDLTESRCQYPDCDPTPCGTLKCE
jgi:hypothetical protein